jgi:Zn-dependent protease
MPAWKLGRVFGIGIYVHWTLLLLLGFVVYLDGSPQNGGPVHAATLLTLVFGCVLLHELGHALAARHFGIGTRDITLYPIGGIARLERMPEKPWEEFWIALAGPAVNVLIVMLAVFAVFAYALAQNSAIEDVLNPKPGNYPIELIVVNCILVFFNLLPAFPMDGGRVLRALLVRPYGRVQATRIAAAVGAVFTLLFCLAAYVWSQPMLFIVAIFVFFAGQLELAAVQRQGRQQEMLGGAFAPAGQDGQEALPFPEATRFSGIIWDNTRHVWVLWQNGKPVQTFGMHRSNG